MPRPTDPRVKAAALADLSTGMAPGEVARKYGLPVGTAKGWGARLRQAPVTTVTTVSAREEIERLVFEYITSTLKSLTVQAEAFADPIWLKGHNPSALAELHGIMAERVARVLAAIEPSEDATPHSGGPPVVDAPPTETRGVAQ